MSKITYTNKVTLNDYPDIANINKCTAGDLNEIKTVVNENDDNVGDLSNLTTPNTNDIVSAINSIVESGSNANGNYIKYSDGTMICTKVLTITTQCNSAWGSLYESSFLSFGDTAETFTAIPTIFTYASTRSAFIEGLRNTTTNNFGSTWLARPVADQNAEEYTINLVAIGKWK